MKYIRTSARSFKALGGSKCLKYMK